MQISCSLSGLNLLPSYEVPSLHSTHSPSEASSLWGTSAIMCLITDAWQTIHCYSGHCPSPPALLPSRVGGHLSHVVDGGCALTVVWSNGGSIVGWNIAGLYVEGAWACVKVASLLIHCLISDCTHNDYHKSTSPLEHCTLCIDFESKCSVLWHCCSNITLFL